MKMVQAQRASEMSALLVDMSVAPHKNKHGDRQIKCYEYVYRR